MRVFACDHLEIKLPEQHRFPIQKYSLLRKRVQNLKTVKICYPMTPTRSILSRVHSKEYIDKIFKGELSKKELQSIGFPWSTELVQRSLYSVGCTISAAIESIKGKLSCSLAGGTHHAGYDHGDGFCVFNDVAIAVSLLRAKYPAMKILVVDTDVHQGNGTADLLANLSDVFTLSLHSARNYPHKKSHSNIDVSFPDGTLDNHYIRVFSDALDEAIKSSKADFVFFLAGADVFSGDRLGRLNLSKEGIKRRDDLFFSKFDLNETKITVVMGGGYAINIEDIVDIHLGTIESAVKSLYGSVDVPIYNW